MHGRETYQILSLNFGPDAMKSGIYFIRNTRNSKFYVGSTRDFKAREKSHFAELKSGIHHCNYLQNAYASEAAKTVFVFEYPLLVCCDDTKILEMYEQQFLDFYKDTGRLYNTSLLAGRPPEWTPERRKKLSDMKKGKPGRPHTEETKAKLSAIRKGKPLKKKDKLSKSKAKLSLEELRSKISLMKKGNRYGEANKGRVAPNKGILHTEETKAKMKLAQKARYARAPHTPETRAKISATVKSTLETKRIVQQTI